VKLKVLIIAALVVFFSGFKSSNETIIAPYLLNVSSASIQIHWEVEAGRSVVKFGTDKKLGNEISVQGKTRKQQVELKGLEADTKYYYQVESGNHIFGPHAFKTAPTGEKKITFCAYGDNRIKDTSFKYPHPHGLIIAGIQRDHPDFFINTGDIFKTGVDSSFYMEDFFLGAKNLIANTPMFLAIGNHEYIGDPDATATKKYFGFPVEQTWFQTTYGNVQFLFLDSTRLLYKWIKGKQIKKTLKDIENDEQFHWLEDELIKSKLRWRIVVMHHHIFSSGLFGIDNLLEQTLVPLLEKNAVDLVLCGHEHNYERSVKNGITYVLTGGGGSYLRPVNVNKNPYQKSAAAEFHHVRITVEGNQLVGTTFCDVDRKTISDYSEEYKLESPRFDVGDVIDDFELVNTN
jgi:3',5'-cyclic AMP phosphodiesterase CpdA